MLKNLSLSLKLTLLPAIALLGLLLFVVYTALQLSHNDQRLLALESTSYPTLERADAAIFQFSRLPALLNSAVAAGELTTLDEARGVLKEIASLHDSLKPLTQDDAQLSKGLQDWQAAVKRYADNALAASEQLIAGSADFEDLRPNLDRMSSDLQAAQRVAEQFRQQALKNFQHTLAQAREGNASTTRTGIILAVLLVLVVSAGALLVIRGIMANVHGVIASLRAIAQGDGDLTRRVTVEAHDEIGAMIELFNGFLDKLQGTIRQIIDAAAPLGNVSKELYQLTQEAQGNSRSQ